MSDERLSQNLLFDPDQDLVPDTATLQGVAHPLRLRLLGLLRVHGPSTATRLAEQCGESSGLTSYHLRQLAVAGLVADAEPDELTQPSGGRQRWWKAVGRSISTQSPPEGDDEAEAVRDEFARTALAATSTNARRWLSVAHSWPRAWREVATFSDVALRLTRDEATQLGDEIAAVIAKYRRHDPMAPRDEEDDTLIISAQYQVFPEPEQDPPATE